MGSTYDTRGISSRFQLPLPKTKKRFGYMGEFRLEKNYSRICVNASLNELELLASPASLIRPYHNFRLEYFIKG